MRLVAVLFVVAALAGCKDTRVEDPDPVGLRDKIWDDVPLARDMKYKGEGKQIPGSGIRSYRMELRGGIGVKNAVEFYKQVLPVHDWELRRESGEASDGVTLVFWKDEEQLTLEAAQETMQTTLVLIRIGPK